MREYLLRRVLSPKAVEASGKDWARKPVGTGPFMLKDLIPGDRIVLLRSDGLFS
jgi:ABC-type oligopeptide transport system substrate-binding subunit